MNFRIRFYGLTILAALLILTWPGNAAQLSEEKAKRIPEPLKAWEGWVTWNEGHRDCPTPYSDSKKHLCFWPSRLNLQVDASGARFNFSVTVFHEAWVPLPGKSDTWPLDVKANDAPLPVVSHDDKPSVRLKAGTYQLNGSFRWKVMPQGLPLPTAIGLLELSLDGQSVEFPSWDSEGFLWLKRDATSDTKEKDYSSVKIYSVLEDGVPLWLRLQIELTVSGKSREEELGSILPAGWKLASVDSQIPVAIDDQGSMKAQLRTGQWTVHADAFRVDNPKEIRYPENIKPAVGDQLIAFRAKPDFRMVEILGATPVDVSQTMFPGQWRDLPLYRWNTATPLRIEEKMRGMGQQKPAGLAITRELWLDDGGREFTFRDEISGHMQQIWRLDVAPGQKLGAVRSDGSGQLITRNPKTGAPGVEIRTRDITLEATGRMDRAQSQGLSASGWNADADGLNVTLNLPPGWRLFALFGADWVRGDWLTSWTLLDLFVLLIFCLAVFRLFGLVPAVIAFLALLLSFHEPGSPRFIWLLLLAPIAVLRAVPEGWGRRVLLAVKWLLVGVFVFIVIPFLVAQIQQVLYPQLEDTSAYSVTSHAPSDFVSQDGGVPASSAARPPQGMTNIQTKLERIIIPKLDFREATLREAINYLETQSAAHDYSEPDPARRGIKILLKLDQPSATLAPAPQDAPKIPGLEAMPGHAEPPSAPITPNEVRITVSLANIPLGEAIRYVTGLANLKFKVDPYGVSVVPRGTPTETLITKEFPISPGFLATLPESPDSTRGGSSLGRRAEARDFLSAQGVAFPPGSSAIYLPSASKIIIRNTQENLDLVDAIVNAAMESGVPGASANLQTDPGARIQTGPAIPEWPWRSVRFGWNGPVLANQTVRPVLISLALERLLTILRILLVLALAAVLLNPKRINITSLFGKRSGVVSILLCLFWMYAGSSAWAQFPDQRLLDTLRERLTEVSDAYPNAADIPSVSMTVAGRRITADAEIHAATRTAVPLPVNVKIGSPLSVVVDGKPEVALRREDDSLWVVLAEGVHRVRVEALLPDISEWILMFRLKPHWIKIDAPDWTITGVSSNGMMSSEGVPDHQVFFALKQPSTGGAATYERQDLQSLVSVERHIDLGLRWQIRTTVSRLSKNGKAVALRIPLLAGENVLTADSIVKDGFIDVRLGANEGSFLWESELPITPSLPVATRSTDSWVERWDLVVSPVWNVAASGLPPVFETGRSDLIPTWNPWPGESVKLDISRPEAIPGATVTVKNATHEITLGKRQRASKLDLSLRSSLGEDFLIDLSADADITALSRDGQPLPVRKDGAKLIVPLRPGDLAISAEWKLNRALGSNVTAEEIRLPVESANVSSVINLPDDRWVLWTYGPLRGPAVRFWGILVFSLLAAWILGRLPRSPIRSSEWMLLVIGLTQVPLFAALAVVGWFFLLEWRGHEGFQRLGPKRFNFLQLFLIALTTLALGILIAAVGEGLLGKPEMFISGNNSSRTTLRWYQARSESLLPRPGFISISIWWYRLLMLAWALWLASAVIRWLKWGWQKFSAGGFFKKMRSPKKTPPPLPSAS